MSNRDFVLLKGTVDDEHIKHLLGRVVVDQEYPTLEDFAPHSEDASRQLEPEMILPQIANNPITSNDINLLISLGKTAEVRAKLSNLFKTELAKKTNNKLELAARRVAKIGMTHKRHKFDELMRNPEYKAQVEELRNLHKDKKLAFVTGMLISQELRYAAQDEAKKGWLFGINVPIGKIFNLPTSELDPGVETEYSISETQKVRAKIDQEVIFAVQYDDDIVEQWFRREQPDSHWHAHRRKSPSNLDTIPQYLSPEEPGTTWSSATSEQGSDDENDFGCIGITQLSPSEFVQEVDRKQEALDLLAKDSEDTGHPLVFTMTGE